VAEVLEKPEGARRAYSRLFVVHDDGRGGLHSVRLEQVLDHPHECIEWSRICVDQAHAPQVHVDRAWNMTRGVLLWGSKVEDQGRFRAGAADHVRKLFRLDQQFFVRETLHVPDGTTSRA
jgi:hypothetical protein